jgi:ankyrin repeat protein
MRILCLLVLILLALEGASAQSFQLAPREQKPAATPESAGPQLFAALDQDEVDLEVVRKLLNQNPALVNVKSEDGDTPLHIAAGRGQEEIIKLLLSMHAAVNARNEENLGRTPLHDAVSVGKTRSIELLLAAKAEVNAADTEEDTALHMVGSKADAELLLANGGNLEAKNRGKRTPLLKAIGATRPTEVVETLLGHNADVNARDVLGNTALHLLATAPLASRQWISDTTELLLANKADLNAKNNEGQTPLMMAIKLKNKAAIEILRKHGAK